MRGSRRSARLMLSGVLLGLSALCGAVLPAVPAAAVPAAWHVTPSPDRAGANELGAVSCSGPQSCAAVGETRFGAGGTLIEMWDGHRWSLTASPSPGRLPDRGTLVAVSCPTSRFCAAVGYYTPGSLSDLTLIEIWNGKQWSVSPSRNPGKYSHLLGVSCASSSDCEAVGFYLDNCSPHAGGSAGLVERWDGHDWSVVPSPRQSCRTPQLQAVSCPTGSSCTAVGSYFHGTGGWTLVESWDGTRWSVVPSPNPAPGNNNDLQGVSCSGTRHCVAVGAYQRAYAGPELTLAETWNGTRWSIVPTPRARNGDSTVLAGVSCTGAANCVAAGDRADGFGNADTLVESWDGSAWSVTSSPNPRPAQQLLGVDCTRGPRCVAVGYDGTSTDRPFRTLVETGS